MLLEPWTNGSMYKNYVFDDNKKELRGITKIEYMITEYCFSHSHHLNRACEELGYNKFEMEPYHTNSIKDAGQAIYDHEQLKKGYRSKFIQSLLKELPEYLAS